MNRFCISSRLKTSKMVHLKEHTGPLDLSHHLSKVTKNRTPSSIKNYYRFFKISGIGNLASGLPNASYFPFDTLEAEVAHPSRWDPTPEDSSSERDDADTDAYAEGSPRPSTSTATTTTTPPSPTTTTSLLVVPKTAVPASEPSKRVDVATALQYGTAGGYPPLLSWIRQFTREVLVPAVPYEPGPDVILSCGSTDGLFKLVDLLYDSWLPGRDAVADRPGLLTELFVFNNVLPVVEPHGIRIAPVEIDGEGMLARGPGSLDDVLRNWDPATGKRPHVLYTVTSTRTLDVLIILKSVGHNPTAGVQSLQRKKELYAVCREFDIVIIEDDPYWYLQFPTAAAAEAQSRHVTESLSLKRRSEEQDGYDNDDDRSRSPRKGLEFIDSLVPSYLSLDIDGRVIRLDTLSKTMAPGCRTGWITAQPSFIERLERITEISTQQPSGFAQAMIIQLLAGQQPDALHAFADLPAHKRGAFSGWRMDGWVRWLAGLRSVYERRAARMCAILDQGTHQVLPELEHKQPPPPPRRLSASGITPTTTNGAAAAAVSKRTQLLSFDWPRGGMFVWLRVHYEEHPLWMARGPGADALPLDGPAMAAALLAFMARKPHLVLPSPGTMFGATPDVVRDRAWRHLRLCFTAESEENIDACSRRLTNAVHKFWLITDLAEMEELHDLLVAQRVLLLDGAAAGDGLALGGVEGALDFGAVDEAGQVGLGDDVGRQEEVALEGGGLGGGAVDVVEGLEGSRGPDDEAAEVATGGELEQVKGRDGAGLDTGDVAEALDELLAVGLGGVDDEGTAALAVAAATELALAGAELLGALDLGEVVTGADGLEEAEGGGGAAHGAGLEEGGVDNQGNLGDVGDLVATGHQERGGGGGSQGGAGSVAPERLLLAFPSPCHAIAFGVAAYFWPWLTLTCHLRQILVGANMRPERHMLPKAA
ncbi:aromatic amino acid aminotransferase [Purpureocillium lavendulum]|uniref:Aromatic amino acid aminotransferase n=1 Tax=Purpureocillium lavendulum TaxID=1247861 RepID=A0AB34FJV1_9HYPO|nr:aromatic amino acid aminotransferase [Purpureocillium lavendulum]